MSDNKRTLPVIHENVPVKYYKGFQRVEPVEMNSGRLRDYKFCPEFYRFKNVLGYKPKEAPIYWAWGRTIHKFLESLEVIYSARGKGFPLEGIVGLATIEAMKEWGDTKDPAIDDRKFGFMTKARIADLLMFIAKYWIMEKEMGKIEVLSAEKTFSVQLPDGQFITGTPDQPLIRWQGSKYVRDFKSTTKEFKYYKRGLFPNDQFTRYTYGAQELAGDKISGFMVDIFYMTRDKGPSFHREIIGFSKEVLDRWVADQTHWKHVIDYSRENDSYPLNENNCIWCPFHKVCQSQSQMGKEYTLKSEYVFAPWDNVREGSLMLMR